MMEMSMDPGFIPVIGFGLVVVVGGLLMAAISFFSMKETTFEDVMAKQRQEKEQEHKEKNRINKQKREQYKRKFELKKKKHHPDNGKPSSEPEDAPGAPEAQVKSSTPAVQESKKKKNKPIAPPKEELPKSKEQKEVPAPVEITKQETKPVNKKSQESVSVSKSAEPTKPKKVEKPKEQSPPAKVAKEPPVIQPTQAQDETSREQRAKKKKTKKQPEENPLVEAFRTTDLDDTALNAISEILKEKVGDGIWSSVGSSNINKEQNSDLLKQLSSKEAEIVKQTEQLSRNQQQIDQLKEAIEGKTKIETNLQASNDQQKQKIASLEQEIHRIQEEDKKKLSTLQNQVHAASAGSGNLQSLKDENAILRSTIQANAQAVSDKKHLTQNVRELEMKLSESEKARQDLERKIDGYSENIKQRETKMEQSYQSELEMLTKQVQDAQGRYSKLESDFKQAQNDLQFSQTKSAELLDQVVMLNEANDQRTALEKEFGSLSQTKAALEERVLAMDENDAKHAEELATLHTKNKDLTLKVDELSAKNKTLQDELSLLQRSTNKASDNLQKQSDTSKDAEIATMTATNEQYKKQIASFEEEISKLKKKNNELRERNWKAMDAVSAAERDAKQRIATHEEKLSEMVNKIEAEIKAELMLKFPGVSCDEKNFKSWLPKFLELANDTLIVVDEATNEEDKKRIEELEKENTVVNERLVKSKKMEEQLKQSWENALQHNKLLEERAQRNSGLLEEKEAEVEKYKNILNSTETILSNLQDTVENDEEITKTKLKQAEEEQERLRNDAKKQISDIEKKLNDKSEQLAKTNAECERLKQELNEISEQAASFCDHSSSPPLSIGSGDLETNAAKLIEEDQGFLIVNEESAPTLSQENGSEDEVTKLKERLEKEKALTKSLGAAANKLQVVLKQTQEQLSKEREKNKESVALDSSLSSELD